MKIFTPKFEIEQNQSDANVFCDEGNLKADIAKYTVKKLLRLTKLQMLESEMEKKYSLYHIFSQNLELEQMKRQMGIAPEFNNFLDLFGLTGMPTCFPPGQTRQCKAPRARSNSSGRDYLYDDSSYGEFSNEHEDVWRIVNKLIDKPEFGSTDLLGVEAEEKLQPKNQNFVKDAYEVSNQHEKCDENQKPASQCGNLGQGRNAMNLTWDEHISQKVNFELFKTEICRSWAQFGVCLYGLNCHFAHGNGELRVRPKPNSKYKTEMCKKYFAGYCPYGSRCNFVHKPNEAINKYRGQNYVG